MELLEIVKVKGEDTMDPMYQPQLLSTSEKLSSNITISKEIANQNFKDYSTPISRHKSLTHYIAYEQHKS